VDSTCPAINELFEAANVLRNKFAAALIIFDDVPLLLGKPFDKLFSPGRSKMQKLLLIAESIKVILQPSRGVAGLATGTAPALTVAYLCNSGASCMGSVAVLLKPLTPADIKELLTISPAKHNGFESRLEELGVRIEEAGMLAKEIHDATGGIAGWTHHVIHNLEETRLVGTRQEMFNHMVEQCRLCMPLIPHDWTIEGDIDFTTSRPVFLRAVSFAVATGAVLKLNATIKLPDTSGATTRVPFIDMLGTYGIPYSPLPGNLYKLVPGRWIREQLIQDLSTHNAANSVFFERVFATFGDTFMGRPLEFLVAAAIYSTAAFQAGKPIGSVWPAIAEYLPPGVLFSKLDIVPLPASNTEATKLSAEEKADLVMQRPMWPLQKLPTIHSDDMAWLLLELLPFDTIVIPADLSGSQHVFVKLRGCVLAFALKAYCKSAPASLVDVEEEMSKMPGMGEFERRGVRFVLVLASLHIDMELQVQLDSKKAWECRTGLPSVAASVILNPMDSGAWSGGLTDILGEGNVKLLTEATDGFADTGTLLNWVSPWQCIEPPHTAIAPLEVLAGLKVPVESPVLEAHVSESLPASRGGKRARVTESAALSAPVTMPLASLGRREVIQSTIMDTEPKRPRLK
jgi:hypothetical protein